MDLDTALKASMALIGAILCGYIVWAEFSEARHRRRMRKALEAWAGRAGPHTGVRLFCDECRRWHEPPLCPGGLARETLQALHDKRKEDDACSSGEKSKN